MVVALLSDPKVEVRHLAAATLSGMIKGMAQPAREALQAQLLGQAAQLFKTGRKRAKQAAGSSAQVSCCTCAASAVQCTLQIEPVCVQSACQSVQHPF